MLICLNVADNQFLKPFRKGFRAHSLFLLKLFLKKFI